MDEKRLAPERCCGNCRWHDTYQYPDVIFCFLRYEKREDAILSVFDCCKYWTPDLQECFCIKDALRKREKR